MADANRSEPGKYAMLAIVGLGVFMCTLDTSIVNVSLPAIAQHFGVAMGASIEWVVIAYLVVIASTLLAIGRLADRIGQRPVWLCGLVAFTAGSALCGASPTLWALIAARGVQGIGGAMLMAVSPAMLTAAFPASERGRALGLNATIVGLGVSAGPALGGMITEASSWRWIFLVNLPVGIAAVIASAKVLPRSRRRGVREAFDVAGAVLLGSALASLTIALSVANTAGWRSPSVIGLLCAFAALAAVFAWRELRAPAPLLDFGSSKRPRRAGERPLFRDPVFVSSTVSLVLGFMAAFSIAFLLPFYFVEIRHFDQLHTGLALTPYAVAIAVVAPLAGHVADRIGTRLLAALGMAALAAGLVSLAFLTADSSTFDVIWRQVLAAAGFATFSAPNNSALMGAAPRERQGVAAGTMATGRTTGQSIGVAVAGVASAAAGGGLAGMRTAFLVAAAIACVAVVTSLLRGRRA
jgi:EmrB/QacA subfamily drug resistance transporter|nr:DHA2 family efflux MFS transporter permease subunit [Kofleriaceae bacterium]